MGGPGSRVRRRVIYAIRRVLAAVVLASALGLVLVATTFPFRFRTDQATVAWKLENIDWRLSIGRPNVDMVQNLLLMAPLGLGLALSGRLRRPRRVALEAALAALALSVAVEGLQVLLPGRFPQLPDVLRNVCGGAAAGALGAALRERARHHLTRLAVARAAAKQ